MVPLHCPGGFDTTGISPISPPLPPFSGAAPVLSQWTSENARTTRMLLGLPCTRIPLVARVSGKCTDYSAISKNIFHATVQQNRLDLQAENKKVFENICASVQFPGTSCPTRICGERHAVRFRALPCEFSPTSPRKGGEGGNFNACNKFGPPPSPPFRAVHLKWEKWIFHRPREV